MWQPLPEGPVITIPAGSTSVPVTSVSGFEVGQIVVAIAEALRFAEADAVNDAGVVEFVGDDGVLRSQQRLEEPAVGIEAGAVEKRVLGAEELA